MNANTAFKINDAVSQAIRCGESTEDVLRQVKRALDTARADQAIDTARLDQAMGLLMDLKTAGRIESWSIRFPEGA